MVYPRGKNWSQYCLKFSLMTCTACTLSKYTDDTKLREVLVYLTGVLLFAGAQAGWRIKQRGIFWGLTFWKAALQTGILVSCRTAS